MAFWEIVWFMILTFLIFAYLMLLFSIIRDLFRTPGTSGWIKALWVVCLIVFPFVTALIYIVVHGRAMAERTALAVAEHERAEDDHIRRIANEDKAARLRDAQLLLDQGTIDSAEFEDIKRRIIR
ncbi:PLDc N-terminal domain-containing protein [Nocardia sp. NPDC004068]|uniref:PLDc N-terminal domain-containing protein n=1 Tax=Nocardia sp. NPDC004068 TaxID=3364303 RepID=UPI003674FA76